MAFLTIEGLTVRCQDAPFEDVQWGDVNPAFSGKMRSDVRARHRTLRITTTELDTVDALALRLILQSPGRLRCAGDLVDHSLGTFEADFHRVGPVRVRPVTATDFVVSFELRETATEQSVLLWSHDGAAPGNPTFTRTGTAAYIDEDGVLQLAADGVLRSGAFATWRDGVPYTRLEVPVTNLCTWSDALSNWTSLNSAGVTDEADSWGDMDFSLLEDDDGGVSEARAIVIAFTGDGTKALAFWVAEPDNPGAAGSLIKLRDTTAGADRLSLTLTWTSGVLAVVAGTGTVFSSEFVGMSTEGRRIYEVQCSATGVVAANTNRIEAFPAAGGVANTGDMYLGGVAAADQSIPIGSYIPTAGSVAGRGAEIFRDAFPWTPRQLHAMGGCTLYPRFIEGMAVGTTSSERVMQIGAADNSNPRLFIFRTALGGYTLRYVTADGTTRSATAAIAADRLDDVQLAAQFVADGDDITVRIIGRKNGGSDTDSGASATIAPDDEFSDDLIHLAGVGTTSRGIQDYRSAKVFAGLWDIDECEKLAAARLHRREAA